MVILVGPAGYLECRGKGQWIDSFDKVARINLAYPVQNTDDYGTRTDILYTFLEGKHLEYFTKKYIALLEDIPLVCVGFRTHEGEKHLLRNRHGDILLISHKFRKTLRDKVGSAPTTGLLAIEHLLSLYGELCITGIDCYRSGHDRTYTKAGCEGLAPSHDAENERIYITSLHNVVIDRDSGL